MAYGITGRSVWAARAAFIALGAVMAVWAALVPYAKVRLGVDESLLGLLLLCLGSGAVCAMPCAGALSGKFGCRAVLLAAVPPIGALLLLLSVITSVPVFACCLFLLGVMTGILDVVMNIQAVLIEKHYGRSMMSGFHGMYSLGGILGAGSMTALLGALHLPPLHAIAVFAAALCAVIFLCCARYFLPYGAEDKSTPLFVWPRGMVLVLGGLCFMLYMGEGVVLDWAALFLMQERAVPVAQAGQAFALFSLTTTAGRLAGDRLVQLCGAKTLLVGGGLCAAAGYALALASTSAWCAYAGLALVGLGAANMIPQLFSLAARQKGMPAHLAIMAVTTVGYLGLLVGPALMGFVAHGLGLPMVFALMASFMLVVSAVSCVVK